MGACFFVQPVDLEGDTEKAEKHWRGVQRTAGWICAPADAGLSPGIVLVDSIDYQQ
ncbi:MAG: hypothetical protein ACE5HE_10515 [Phycisphaerae bacterium]